MYQKEHWIVQFSFYIIIYTFDVLTACNFLLLGSMLFLLLYNKEKADTLFKIENALSLPGTEKEQGTGLGLKLCKEFTEKMGGRIWVESNVGEGSEFKFTIPLKGAKT